MKGKVFDIADKITILYLIHFGNKHPELANCKDCVDYELGLCADGVDNVLECMADKAGSCEFYSYI